MNQVFLRASLFASISFFPLIGIAHDGNHKPIAAKPADVYKPSLIPDRIVLTWKEDPRTTQAVTWRTSTEVAHAMAQIAVATDGPILLKQALQVEATTQHLKTDINEAHFHSANFIDLTPDTKYAYRVGDGENWSEWFHFTTAPAKPSPFSFIYFGDAQNDLKSHWSRVVREAYSDAPKAKFMLHAGDLINRAEADAEWGEWFYAGSFLHSMMASVAIPGNHEQAKLEDGTRRLSHHWRAQFELPSNGPEGLSETCYTFEYSNVRFICLNSNEKIEEQSKWLNSVLAKNQSRWVVCSFHHPIFSAAKDRDNAALRKAWKPIFDVYRVDLVLTGHDHTYGRTGLETPLEVPETVSNVATGENKLDPTTGTVYVVSVSGPKMYSLQPSQVMKRVAEDTQLYQIIHVDGDELRYEARTATGSLYDAFTLRKRAGEINQLIEGKPAIEERRRPAAPVAVPTEEAKAIDP
jgi:hypothetical protein